eukprot:scaffold92250_cov61-Phaeocystis_antarctica.AAC.1
MRCGAWSAGGRRRATAVQAAFRAGLDCRLGAGHGEERTWNILVMSVTLEVSKLSGWLNADARCRDSNGGMRVRGAWSAGGRRRATAVQAAFRAGLDCRLGAGHGRGAHVEHVDHPDSSRGVPAGNVCVEILQVCEERAHVVHGRDVPVGDEAVCRNGGLLVDIVLLGRRP